MQIMHISYVNRYKPFNLLQLLDTDVSPHCLIILSQRTMRSHCSLYKIAKRLSMAYQVTKSFTIAFDTF